MAITFLEPGGDATFNVATTTAGGFWGAIINAPVLSTDFVHGNHIKSIKYRPNVNDEVRSSSSFLADSGTRYSMYIYFVTLPNATSTIIGDNNSVHRIRLTSGGVIQLWSNTAQIGTDGATLSTGKWYRISLAYTITSTSINRFELFINGTSSISITNATLGATGSSTFRLGNQSTNLTLDFRSSDHYFDNSNSLKDTGDIWVTAKRPNANGTANNFVTQIGAGGSGYGAGHSPQVNERALSQTNGWSVVAVGATTEEYNIEAKNVGDIDITNSTIVGYSGWVNAKSLTSETGQIILNNATSNISLTSTATMFNKLTTSSTYPASTGTDIGIISDATATTVSLYECGVMVAYIPRGSFFNFM